MEPRLAETVEKQLFFEDRQRLIAVPQKKLEATYYSSVPSSSKKTIPQTKFMVGGALIALFVALVLLLAAFYILLCISLTFVAILGAFAGKRLSKTEIVGRYYCGPGYTLGQEKEYPFQQNNVGPYLVRNPCCLSCGWPCKKEVVEEVVDDASNGLSDRSVTGTPTHSP
jgi:hypothetical protein